MMLCNSVTDLKSVDERHCLFESKKDGIRASLIYARGKIRILSREHKDITEKYPELSVLKFPFDCWLDGEIVYEKDGKCDFETLMSRQHTQDSFKIKLMSKNIPVVFYAFDILFRNEDSWMNDKLFDRKEQLLDLKAFENVNFKLLRWVFTLNEAIEMTKDEEGIIIKRLQSKYQMGVRSDDWLKFKKHVEKVVRFTDYEDNVDNSITLTDGFHRVKCNDLSCLTGFV